MTLSSDILYIYGSASNSARLDRAHPLPRRLGRLLRALHLIARRVLNVPLPEQAGLEARIHHLAHERLEGQKVLLGEIGKRIRRAADEALDGRPRAVPDVLPSAGSGELPRRRLTLPKRTASILSSRFTLASPALSRSNQVCSAAFSFSLYSRVCARPMGASGGYMPETRWSCREPSSGSGLEDQTTHLTPPCDLVPVLARHDPDPGAAGDDRCVEGFDRLVQVLLDSETILA